MVDPPVVSLTPWWYSPLLSAVVTLLGGGIGAWLGGKLGVAWETEKLVKQRAFDHRLDWYVRTIRSLSELQFRNVEFDRCLREGDPNMTKILRDKVSDLAIRFDGDVRESLLFGSPSSVRVLTEMNLQVNQVLKTAVAGAVRSEAANAKINDELSRAYESLSHDVREHLGLEELPRELTSPPRDPASAALSPP